MAYTAAAKRAQANYEKRSVRQLNIKFYPKNDSEYKWVKAQPNVQEYVRGLIRKDMERARAEQVEM